MCEEQMRIVSGNYGVTRKKLLKWSMLVAKRIPSVRSGPDGRLHEDKLRLLIDPDDSCAFGRVIVSCQIERSSLGDYVPGHDHSIHD